MPVCAYDYWYDWDTTACGPAANWDSLSYYFEGITFTNYWLAGHTNDFLFNTAVCLKILKDRIDLLGAPADVNMDAILSAMMSAEYDQLYSFVSIEDAYRASMWDEWFNIEEHTELVRGFQR